MWSSGVGDMSAVGAMFESGPFLCERLASAGFSNLMGVDPFIAQDVQTPSGVPIKKVTLTQVTSASVPMQVESQQPIP